MDTIAKILTVALVAVLIIILPSLFGGVIATHMPSVFAAIGYILQVVWHALQDIFMVGHHINN